MGEGDGVGIIEEVVDLLAHLSDERQQVTGERFRERVEPGFAAGGETLAIPGAQCIRSTSYQSLRKEALSLPPCQLVYLSSHPISGTSKQGEERGGESENQLAR